MQLTKYVCKLLHILLVSIPFNIHAQHCRWDGASIMVIAIQKSNNDTLSLNAIHITVTDSLGNPCYYPYYHYRKPDTIQVQVYQNQLSKPVNTHTIDYLPNIRYFWFAGNNYILQAPDYFFYQKGVKLVVDINADNQTRKIMLPLNADYAFPLCHNYSNWENGPGNELMEGFRVLKIVLNE
jgi:hypothetical protein